MADPNLVRLLREDPASWQNPYPSARADLVAASLSSACLNGVDLSGADLSGADLSGADLNMANLSFAILSRADFSGATLTEANLRWTLLTEADLSRADLSGADVSDADLSRANLRLGNLANANLGRSRLTNARLNGATLPNADLHEVNLVDARLAGANLSDANLTGAYLDGANLHKANLTGANLRRANLSWATITAAVLSRTNLTRATFGYTVFANIDFSSVIDLESGIHEGPSTVGVDTLFRTGPGISQAFLRGCGVPASSVSYIDDLVRPVSFMHFRTFLSYSTIDNDFADRLYRSLFDDHAISTWRDVHQILPGDPLMASIDNGINDKTDKMVLICSRGSLSGESSWWTTQEIERAFKRERDHQKQTGDKLVYLIPISIDGFLFSDECTHEYKATLLERRAANFVGWQSDADRYNAELKDLLNALRVKPIRPGDFDTPRA